MGDVEAPLQQSCRALNHQRAVGVRIGSVWARICNKSQDISTCLREADHMGDALNLGRLRARLWIHGGK